MNGTEQIAKKIQEIVSFLLDNDLESEVIGYDESELSQIESSLSINLPFAYRTFLGRMGKRELKIFDCQDYSISGLKSAHDVAERLQKESGITLGDEVFVYSQWQGYQFFYLKDNSPNTEVGMITQGDNGVEKHDFGLFTEWVHDLVISGLTLVGQMEGEDVKVLLNELKEMKKNAKT